MRLRHSPVARLTIHAPAAAARAAGEADFARRVLGENPQTFLPEAEVLHVPGGSPVSSFASRLLLHRFQRPRAGQARLPRPSRAEPRAAARAATAMLWPAAASALSWVGLAMARWALAPAAITVSPAKEPGIFGIGLGLMAAAAVVFGTLALGDLILFSAATRRGRNATKAQFHAAVNTLKAEGQIPLNARVSEFKPKRGAWDFRFGYAAGDTIFIRRELAAVPWLFKLVLAHELEHLEDHRARGPPGGVSYGFIRSAVRGILAEAKARALEWPRWHSLRKARASHFEQVLSAAKASLHFDGVSEVLLINPGTEFLRDPLLFQKLSGGRARVVKSRKSSPGPELARKPGRFTAVVWDKHAEALPKPGTRGRGELEKALRHFNSLHQLLMGRPVPESAGIELDDKEKKAFDNLRRIAGKIARGDKSQERRFHRQVKAFGRKFFRLKHEELPQLRQALGLVENLYAGLKNNGIVYLSFPPGDATLPLWQGLLRFWEAADGGEFRMARVDMMNGGHVLLLRKAESRVSLVLRPRAQGAIKESLPLSGNLAKSRSRARILLKQAGFNKYLAEFERLGVEVRHILGRDFAADEEIHVSVPYRNLAALRRLLRDGREFEVNGVKSAASPRMIESAPIEDVPRLWESGINGKGERVAIVDTGLFMHHDLEARAIVRDVTNTGLKDTDGHGTVVAGIAAGSGDDVKGTAHGASLVAEKVFGDDGPGATDADIRAGITDSFKNGAGVVNLSLGSEGYVDSVLARFVTKMADVLNSLGEKVIFTIAAGNEGPFDRTEGQPATANSPNVLAVGSATKKERVSLFSSLGPTTKERPLIVRDFEGPHLVAVGGGLGEPPHFYGPGVLATRSADSDEAPDDSEDRKYTHMSGTSQASPQVAGIAADLKQFLRKVGVLQGFVAENIGFVMRFLLQSSAKDLDVPTWSQGAGEVQANQARNLARGLLKLGDPWLPVRLYKEIWDLQEGVYAAAKGAKKVAEALARFWPESQKAAPRLLELLNFRLDVEVPDAPGGSQTMDAGWTVRRFAALALGNFLGQPEALELANKDEVESAMARGSAALWDRALNDPEARVRQMAFLALGKLPVLSPAVMEGLRQGLSHEKWDIRMYSAHVLARQGSREGVEKLLEGLSRSEYAPRFTSRWLLGELKEQVAAGEAELLSDLAKAEPEKGLNEEDDLPHRAVAALREIALSNPEAVTGKALVDLLEATGFLESDGRRNVILTRTISRFFTQVLEKEDISKTVQEEPFKSAATRYVLNNRGAARKPGGLGDLVRLLSQALNIPTEVPTPALDPAGEGVPGVDHVMGRIDVMVEVPLGVFVTEVLDDEFLSSFEAKREGSFFHDRIIWLSVPEHKQFALKERLKQAGYRYRSAVPYYPMSNPADAEPDSAAEVALKIEPEGPLPDIPDLVGIPLIKIKAGRLGVSEARILALLESLKIKIGDPLKNPAVILLDFGGPAGDESRTVLSRYVNQMALENFLVVAPSGNEGPGKDSVASPADADLAVTVGAAEGGAPAYYSSGGSAVDWLEEAGLMGTAAAAQRSALGLQALLKRLSQAFPTGLPEGYGHYLAGLVKDSLSKEGLAQELGASALLEEGLKAPEAAAAAARALQGDVLESHPRFEEAAVLPAPLASKIRGALNFAIHKGLFAAEQEAAQGQWNWTAEIPSRVLDSMARMSPELAQRTLAALEHVFYVLLSLRHKWKDAVPAFELEGGFLRHLLESTLSHLGPTEPLWNFFNRIKTEDIPGGDKYLELLASLDFIVSRLRQIVPASNLRGKAIYQVIARTFAEKFNLDESLDDEELGRIRAKGYQVLWLTDIFKIGEVNRWNGDDPDGGGGSPYALVDYAVKPEYGGEAALKRLVERARALGIEICVDLIPNHTALDSVELQEYPENFLHIIAPRDPRQRGARESRADYEGYLSSYLDEIGVPRHHGRHVFYPVRVEKYPRDIENLSGPRGPKWILVRHPMTPDKSQDVEERRAKRNMYNDMAQKDFSRQEVREREIGRVLEMMGAWGIRVFRRDMPDVLTNRNFYDHWVDILNYEIERAPRDSWYQRELIRLGHGMNRRWAEVQGSEFLDQMTRVAKFADSRVVFIDETYNPADLRFFTDAVNNKVGLYDSLAQRKGGSEIRRQLREVAFYLWQHALAPFLNFSVNHDLPNPYDAFEGIVEAALVAILLFRPTLTVAGFEQGAVFNDNIVMGDRARGLSEDARNNRMTPLDFKAWINWAFDGPYKAVAGRIQELSERYRDIFSEGNIHVPEPQAPSDLVLFTAQGRDLSGKSKVILAALNPSLKSQGAWFALHQPVTPESFAPKEDKTYVLRDVLNLRPNGEPAVYTRSGRELVEKGLFIALEGGKAHVFEVEEQ
ncbi:MAG: S8 family serine peptidase [Elusimicrobia bacterium]|nr:S8 family serine peptidase [Elusimicrobiota bacterium]